MPGALAEFIDTHREAIEERFRLRARDIVTRSGASPGAEAELLEAFRESLIAVTSGAAAASRDAERRSLVEMFAQAPGFATFLRGKDLVFELANPAYLQLAAHRELIGRTVREAFPEVEGQGLFEVLDRIMATGEPFVARGLTLMLQREPAGPLTPAVLDFVYQPIRAPDGSITGILVLGQDNTEAERQREQRQAAEVALEASERRYRTLFESIDDGFCLLEMIQDERGKTIDYRFLEANAAFETHTGLAGAVGRRARELVPDLDESWFETYGRVATTGEATRFESHARSMERWFDVYATRVGDPSARQVALVFKDITERKRAEAERERLLELESRARTQAERASRVKDEFLATVSHELRTPLNAMLGWVQMLRRDAIPKERQPLALETIERNARAQAQLIEDLLDVSSILAGKLRLHVEPVDVTAVIEGVLETVRPAADAKNIRLQAALASGGTVMGDPHRLQQIVWNLLSNAVKFTPKGGRVQVFVQKRDSAVDITVADTGIGITPEFQPFVFDRFRQADGGTTRSAGGLGLGLSIVRQLVEMHGGTVAVTSEGEGKGSTFVVRLPLSVTRAPDADHSLRTKMVERGFDCPPELANLDVVVVDDEIDAREMVAFMLEQCGATVRTAGSVNEALAALDVRVPDLLVSDIGMPDQDGFALIAKVRARTKEQGGNLPAVALTAYARSEDRTRALLAGFNSHVPKPVEPMELMAVIASLAGRTRPTPV
ncbi:MAG: uncharacterized protein JWP97_280 [Labilithrix sp.]|nr:uncharacterized protein [Labilithrix sp.]